MLYWSHAKQEEFSDQVVQRIRKHVLGGMGFITLLTWVKSLRNRAIRTILQ
ncbi:MAG: hypothetical protein MR852_06530 [Treponema sp.]|nr:hypothetical protein [Treponema sp.]